MATPFDRLMDTIKPHLPGALDTAIKQELFFVCKDFLNRSDAWREVIPFTLPAGQRTADLIPFAGRINRLMYVSHEGRGVRGAVLSQPDMSGYYSVVMPLEGSYPHDYEATVAMVVSDPTTREAYPIMPNELVERYTEELIHGILARMYAQPSKPYSNMALAQVYTVQFRSGAARAKNEANNGRTMGSQAWTYPQSFNRRK